MNFPEKCPKCNSLTFLERWGIWVRVRCSNSNECSWWEYYHPDGRIVSKEERRVLEKNWA